MTDQDEIRNRIVEESVSVGKERVATGRVRLSTSSSELEKLAQATLSGTRVEVSPYYPDC